MPVVDDLSRSAWRYLEHHPPQSAEISDGALQLRITEEELLSGPFCDPQQAFSSNSAAHVRLCHSRMLFVRAYPHETQEMVFDAHDRAFALFKGTWRRGTYDNMKTAVPSTDGSVSFFDMQKPPAQGLKQGQRVSRSPLPQSDLTSRVRCGEAQLKLNALPCCC
jgi:hypothetical protein